MVTSRSEPPHRPGQSPGRATGPSSIADIAARLNDRIAALSHELLGEPNRKRSSAEELRFGTKGSVAVEIDGVNKGRWYDHEPALFIELALE